MSQLIQFSLHALFSEPGHYQRGENFNSRQVVVGNGLGAGGGEEAIHLSI